MNICRFLWYSAHWGSLMEACRLRTQNHTYTERHILRRTRRRQCRRSHRTHTNTRLHVTQIYSGHALTGTHSRTRMQHTRLPRDAPSKLRTSFHLCRTCEYTCQAAESPNLATRHAMEHKPTPPHKHTEKTQPQQELGTDAFNHLHFETLLS